MQNKYIGAELVFNGHRHKLPQVSGQASIPIRVPVDEIEIDGEFPIEYRNVEQHEDKVVFYKHNGKYLVLMGRDKVRPLLPSKELTDIEKALADKPKKKSKTLSANPGAVIQGFLISTQALKSTRIIELKPEETAPPSIPAPSSYPRNNYGRSATPEGFENRPRFQTDKPRQYGGGPVRTPYRPK